MVQSVQTIDLQSINKTFETSLLSGLYQDWTERVQSDDFADWLDDQRSEIKALTSSVHINDAANMLEMYFAPKHGFSESCRKLSVVRDHIEVLKNQLSVCTAVESMLRGKMVMQ